MSLATVYTLAKEPSPLAAIGFHQVFRAWENQTFDDPTLKWEHTAKGRGQRIMFGHDPDPDRFANVFRSNVILRDIASSFTRHCRPRAPHHQFCQWLEGRLDGHRDFESQLETIDTVDTLPLLKCVLRVCPAPPNLRPPNLPHLLNPPGPSYPPKPLLTPTS